VYEGRRWEPPEDGSLRQPLPASLDRFAAQATRQQVNTIDPETAAPYGYEVTGQRTYELCATFNASRNESFDVFWNHGPGRTCFLFDVTREDGYVGGARMEAVPAKPL
jgi:hypothetical protein